MRDFVAKISLTALFVLAIFSASAAEKVTFEANSLNFEQIGEKLKKIRLSKNLTQEYIANAADVNTSHISNIENNRVKVSLSVLVQICNALDTTVDYILSDEYNDSSSAIEQEILHELHSCNNETKEQILKIVKALQ